MSNYGTILKALFKNKLRFGEDGKKGKKILFASLIGLVYALVIFVFISMTVSLKELFSAAPSMAQTFYFFVLFTTAVVVLFFGIVHLVVVLYLSKDTDFYSALPVKPTTVFAAKLSYVYLSEAAIVIAIALPVIIAFGVVAKMWAWFYVIAIASLVIAPVLPLATAAIVAIPVMMIASRLKNRSVISLIFYLLLFGIIFGLYIFFVYIMSSGMLTSQKIETMLSALNVMLNILYPYTVLSKAACAIPMYGLGLGASVAVGLLIFVAISAALLVIIWFLARFMYAQSVKANNQTDSSKVKKGEFNTASGTHALIKREYIGSLRTTQIAFQCYAVLILPIILAVIIGIPLGNSFLDFGGGYVGFVKMIGFCTMCAVFSTLGNGASTTFSREGAAMSSLKILPMDGKTVFKAKTLAWLFLIVPATIIAAVVSNVFSFDLTDFLLSILLLPALAVEYTVFGALWDLSSPKLKWTDPIQAVKHNMHVLGGQMIMMANGLAVMIIMFILSSVGVDFSTIFIVSWSLLYSILAAFAVVDILMYRKVDAYYNRIEM